MLLVPVDVECYSGYKAEEAPRRFHGIEGVVEIEEILDRWYQGDADPTAPVSDYFKVRARDGKEHLLKHDRERDAWFLCFNP